MKKLLLALMLALTALPVAAQVRISRSINGDAKRVTVRRAMAQNDLSETNGNWDRLYFPLMVDLSPHMVRSQMSWRRLEPTTQTVFVWTNYDNMVIRYHGAHIQILGQIDETPNWACVTGTCTLTNEPPEFEANFGLFVTALVHRYKPGGALAIEQGWTDNYGVSYWEIRNEVNGTSVANSNWPIATYLLNLRAAKVAIDAEDAQSQVLIAALNPSGLAQVDWKVYLRNLFNAGLTVGDFDIANAHPYDSTACLASSVIDDLILPIRQQLARHGMAGIPLWVTEYGKSTDGGNALRNCYTETAYMHEYDQLFHYDFRGDTADFGLVDHSGVAKDPHDVFRDAIRY